MTIDRILSLIAIIVSFIAVPASGYLSYRYAIVGEKRKEFNAVADTIRQKLREHMSHLEVGLYPAGSYIEITKRDFDYLIDVSGLRVQRLARIYSDNYQLALSECFVMNEYGDRKVTDLAPVIAALEKLMPYVARR